MVFVPSIHRDRPASARARDLSARLIETIRQFERQYPGTSPIDVRRALELAGESGKGARRQAAGAVAVAAGLAAAGVGAIMASSGSLAARELVVVVTALVVVGVVWAFRSRRWE